ncbi:hypothetical protein A2160_01215 [Candidatus Beckwithbacteria bacterium RBG_13_42_9]|uniref:Uncharacterized protein n=1 Tax=Candidatus Beckwithbacteria bacterium RBG_13_42_9 TaxID=1797457 RepID=A0A1F5E3K9_9BACT|nr:MAG: hypothetical protein A2160_01215 [Candidatus Beckwithbacteria bacterium RBG_13_42_9]
MKIEEITASSGGVMVNKGAVDILCQLGQAGLSIIDGQRLVDASVVRGRQGQEVAINELFLELADERNLVVIAGLSQEGARLVKQVYPDHPRKRVGRKVD